MLGTILLKTQPLQVHFFPVRCLHGIISSVIKNMDLGLEVIHWAPPGRFGFCFSDLKSPSAAAFTRDTGLMLNLSIGEEALFTPMDSTWPWLCPYTLGGKRETRLILTWAGQPRLVARWWCPERGGRVCTSMMLRAGDIVGVPSSYRNCKETTVVASFMPAWSVLIVWSGFFS